MKPFCKSRALLCNAFKGAAQSAEHCIPGGTVHLHDLALGSEQDEIARLLPDLVEQVGQHHSWGDICILVRDKKQASDVTSWLMARHIPVVTQGSLTLGAQPVISQLVELLRFLNTPDDDLAFWSVLCGQELLPPCTPSGSPLPTFEELLNGWLPEKVPAVWHYSSARIFPKYGQNFLPRSMILVVCLPPMTPFWK
jgi:hypothetical protein